MLTTPESTIGEGGLPLHSQVFRCDLREFWAGVASVGASPWGLPHRRKPVWRPCYQGWLGCPGSGHGCLTGVELVLGLHQKCPGVVKLMIELHHMSEGTCKGSSRMVKLVFGLHHVSSGGDQRKFLGGEASVWASS